MKRDNLFLYFYSMIETRFEKFPFWFESIKDPRKKNKITYQMRTIMMYVFFTFVFKLGSNRGLSCELSNEQIGIENFIALSQDTNINKLPHPDTVIDVMIKINPLDIEKIGVKITNSIIRKKIFYKHKFLNKYFLIAIDATQQVRFNYRHCDKCLFGVKNGKKYYHHNILVAKLIFPNGITLPIATEFIENNDEYVKYKKQNCETKAAYKLIDRIKKHFPQLHICLLADSEYINSKIFKKCDNFGWKYIISFKEGSASSLFFDYEDFIKQGAGGKEYFEIKENNGNIIKQQMYWKNYLDFKSIKTNVIEGTITEKNKSPRFVYATNIFANHENIFDLINYGGRQRWKIENQCFNEEKNDGYNLEHLYCKDENAMKNYYYCLQIAHTMNQLFEKGIFSKKEIQKLFKGYKYLASKIFRHFLYIKIDLKDIEKINYSFDSS